jgi:3',5'-cyclic AMP phosphodiesterase CpdA
VPARLIHVSDVHVGAREQPHVESALHALVGRVQPDLVIATGDLTHRGRRDQHERVAALLRRLPAPVLAVPGNHDIPLWPPGRFAHPWREFERAWETTEPVHSGDGLHVVGVNSVRPWRHQSGGLRSGALDRVCELLGKAPAGALGVVCLHHQLANAPWRTRKRPLARRGRVLEQLAEAGAELVLSGHVHQAGIAERREFEVLAGERSLVVVTAPGLTRPRPRRLGEAQGAHVISTDESSLTVETHVLDGEAFAPVAERRFPRLRADGSAEALPR